MAHRGELYHRDLGFPPEVSLPSGDFRLVYSKHANRAAKDRMGFAGFLPKHLTIDPTSIFEIQIIEDKVAKFGFRVNFDRDYDLIFIVEIQSCLSGDIGYVKTVWTNNKNDIHKTLDTRKYRRKPD